MAILHMGRLSDFKCCLISRMDGLQRSRKECYPTLPYLTLPYLTLPPTLVTKLITCTHAKQAFFLIGFEYEGLLCCKSFGIGCG